MRSEWCRDRTDHELKHEITDPTTAISRTTITSAPN